MQDETPRDLEGLNYSNPTLFERRDERARTKTTFVVIKDIDRNISTGRTERIRVDNGKLSCGHLRSFFRIDL